MKIRIHASLLALTLALSACGGGAAANSEQPQAVENTPSQQSAPATEKVIRLSRSWEDTSWDPAALTGADQAALAPQIYETLCVLQEDGSSSPLLAESWDISPDGKSYTFHLKKGVQFHRGYGEMTSADVLFSFQRQSDPEVASIHAEALNLENIESIEAPDDYTVVFALKKQDVDFITRVSQFQAIILSKAAGEELGVSGMASTPIGTGPFMFEEGTLGVKTEAVKFPEFWGGEPKIDRVVNTIITDTNTNYSAFENDELDIIFVYYADKVKEYVDKGYIDYYIPSRQLLYVGVNMQSEPWNNEKVREAFFKSIDPQYYIDSLFYGKESFTGGYIPPSCKYALVDYLKPDLDPEGAKSLLSDAGFTVPINTTLWTVNDDISPPPALITQSLLSKAGFNTELQMVDFGVFIDKVRSGEAGMWLLYNSTPVTSDETISRYMSEKYPGSNWCGITDATYDELVSKGVDADSEDEKAEFFKQAQKRLIDLQVLYPVCTYGYDFMAKPNITGIEMWGDHCIRLRNADIS
ncbi:MAG: ABC transporter substrate-binding protein [Clostridiales bacterium]|nr:ABC transporter substrate-binding protein [Clostridiales bacterium]